MRSEVFATLPARRGLSALVLFAVLAVPTFALAGDFPKGTGVAYVLGVVIFGPIRWNQGWRLAAGVLLASMAAILVAGVAGRMTFTLVVLVGGTTMLAGFGARKGWHTSMVAIPVVAAIFTTNGPFFHQVCFATGLGIGGTIGLLLAGAVPPPLRQRESPIGAEAALFFGIVLGLFTTISTLGARFVGTPHGYWLTLTILAIMQPSVRATETKMASRVLGTMAGAMSAVVIASVLHSHSVLVLLGIVAATIATTIATSYGTKMSLYTMMVILFDATVATAFHLAGERIILTLLGAGVVLAFSMIVPAVVSRLPDAVQTELSDVTESNA
jgi:hypothetical protein